MQRIFAEYLGLDGYRERGCFAIAEGLTRDGVPSPSAHDPARNRHRCGVAWSKNAVRAILMNPRYTGYQVWNKQRKDEVLLDVEDVALGPTTTPPHSVGTRATSGSSQKRSHVVSWAGFL
ncbi:hypothetical protein Acsp03_56300 [Actinomadura sp. NBRC 104412]|uniref:recombinase family protein n=1 Tax=Actinomadura sp. NBRC 104412 TaxID=3032203 RepID=UPI0024A1BA5B|nr:recombinase family protein [Actinomadura sp. NBRC 104412]GLZ08164.1 hypothetical protein Acsp03_56300 [Actinomadura sp. NBRC 104412]